MCSSPYISCEHKTCSCGERARSIRAIGALIRWQIYLSPPCHRTQAWWCHLEWKPPSTPASNHSCHSSQDPFDAELQRVPLPWVLAVSQQCRRGAGPHPGRGRHHQTRPLQHPGTGVLLWGEGRAHHQQQQQHTQVKVQGRRLYLSLLLLLNPFHMWRKCKVSVLMNSSSCCFPSLFH